MQSSLEFVFIIKLLSKILKMKYKQISTIIKKIKNLTFVCLLIGKCSRLFLFSIKLRTFKINMLI